jgi:hypothetical protein
MEFEILKLKQNKKYWNEDAFNDIVMLGDLDKIKILKKLECPFKKNTYKFALKNDNMNIVNWLIENKYPYGDLNLSDIIELNDVDKLLWFKDSIHVPNKNECCTMSLECSLCKAIRLQNIEIIKWLKDHNYDFKKCTSSFSTAIEVSNLEILNYIKVLVAPPSFHSSSFNWALERSNGNLEILKIIKEYGCNFSHDTFVVACIIVEKTNNIDLLNWLKKNNCPFSYLAYPNSIINHNLLEWLKNNNCPFDKNILGFVIKRLSKCKKNFINKTLKWFKDNGSPFGENTFDYAINSGNFEIIQWLKDNGCPFGEITFTKAIKLNNIKILEWLKDNGCKFDNKTFKEAYFKCYETLDISIIKWLKNNGCPKGLNIPEDVDFWYENLDSDESYINMIEIRKKTGDYSRDREREKWGKILGKVDVNNENICKKTDGYIYLIEQIQPEDLKSIYKIGKTTQDDPNKRLKNYGNSYARNELVLEKVTNCHLLENILINELKNDNLITKCNMGNEYFYCNDKEYIIKKTIEIIKNNNKL